MSRFSQFTGGDGTGSVGIFLSGSSPTGYLQLCGQCVSKTTYSNLYSVVGDQPPPITDSVTSSAFAPPSGYTCSCYFAMINDGPLCVGSIAIYHCPGTCIGSRLCYAFIGGCCGYIDNNSTVSSLCPCQPGNISVGYDCNTCKLYAAMNYGIPYSGGSFFNANILRVWNITDMCSLGACCIQARCYYDTGGDLPLGQSCFFLCCPQSPGYGTRCFFRICYPTLSKISMGFTCCFYCCNGTCLSGRCLVQSSSFGVCPLYAAEGRNPCLYVGCATTACTQSYDSIQCYGIVAIRPFANNSGEITAMSGPCFTYVGYPTTYPVATCSGHCVACQLGYQTFGYYCDSNYVGMIGVSIPNWTIFCGGNYNCCRLYNVYDPSRPCIFLLKFNKTCILCAPVYETAPVCNYITGITACSCVGLHSMYYLPKCSTYYYHKMSTNCYPQCACNVSITYTCSFFASTNSLPASNTSNTLGLSFYSSDPGQRYSSNALPFTITSTGQITLYGYSPLGPSSNVFLLPSASSNTLPNSLAYFVKT